MSRAVLPNEALPHVGDVADTRPPKTGICPRNEETGTRVPVGWVPEALAAAGAGEPWLLGARCPVGPAPRVLLPSAYQGCLPVVPLLPGGARSLQALPPPCW